MDDKQSLETAAYLDIQANSDEQQAKDEVEKQQMASNDHMKDENGVDVDEEDSLKETNQFDILQFQNSFYECIEELKIQRVIVAENEEKINHLLSVRHDNQRAMKEETSKNSSLIEKHAQEIGELRRKQDEKIHQLEAEKKKLALATDSCEKETRELKDDIRTLQLTKYSLEKRIKEQNQRLQLQGTARTSHLAKMKELEVLGKDISKQCSGLADQLMRLEVNVKASEKLNEKLSFINEHQTCITDSLKSDLDRKTQEILHLRVELDKKPCLEELRMKELQNRKQALEQQLREKETSCDGLVAQLETARITNQSSLEALARSEELCERHLANSNHNAELVSLLNADIDNLKRELGRLREDQDSKEKELQMEKQKGLELVEQFQSEEKSLRSELRTQKDENETLVKASQDLEALNSSWSEKNTEMSEIIRALKEKIALFEKMQKAQPNSETKATNTEVESERAVFESFTEEAQNNKLASNQDIAVNEEDGCGTGEGLQEKAMIVGGDRQESSSDAVSSGIEIMAERCPNPVLSSEHYEEDIKRDETSSTMQGLDRQSNSDNEEPMGLGPTQELDNGGSKECTLKEASGEGSSLSDGSHSLSMMKPEDDDTGTGKGDEECEVKIEERCDKALLEKQGNSSSLTQHEEIQPMANDRIGETVSITIKPAQNPDVNNSKNAQSDCSPGSMNAINQFENQALAIQQDYSMEAKAVTPVLDEQTDQKSVSEKLEGVGKSSSSVVLESAKIQETTQATNSQALFSNDDALPTNPEKHINQLCSNEASSHDQNGVLNAAKLSPNAKSSTVDIKTDVKTSETLKPISDQDLERQDIIAHYVPPSTGLGSVNLTSLLFPKCSVDQLPVSGSQTQSTCSKTSAAKRNPYLLPGMSLLNAQRRRGLTSCVETPLTQPSISLGSIKKEPDPSAFASYSLLGTSSLGRGHDVRNSGDNLSSRSKGKEGSQDWPNFSQEFDPGQNTATLSTENSTLCPLRPASEATVTKVSPKRSRPDTEPLLFSDEDDDTDIKSDVASQISRIQSFLRSDRLKRPRRSTSTSKEPVV